MTHDPLATSRAAVVIAAWLAFGLGTSPVAAQPASPFVGLWLDHTGRGVVELKNCGKAICGSIVWLKEPFSKKGKPITDIYNEKQSKRTRTICGLQIIGNVRQVGRNVYDNGWIYGPEKGKTYDVELRLLKSDRLQVKGYAGIKLLSETYIWKKLRDDHPIRTEDKTCHNAKPE